MINLAIQLLAAQLNQHLRRAYDLNEDRVIVSNLLDMSGVAAPNISNKLVVYLVNIEKESVSPTSARIPYSAHPTGGDRTLQHSAAQRFNLFVMMTANFTGNNYAEALKFLSSTIGYFQRNPVFDHHSTPEMDERIEKLILDVENLSVQDLSNLWSSLGGKYMPSILYRVRMITFDSDEVSGRQPVVTQPRPVIDSH